jgi:hypothetical protein
VLVIAGSLYWASYSIVTSAVTSACHRDQCSMPSSTALLHVVAAQRPPSRGRVQGRTRRVRVGRFTLGPRAQRQTRAKPPRAQGRTHALRRNKPRHALRRNKSCHALRRNKSCHALRRSERSPRHDGRVAVISGPAEAPALWQHEPAGPIECVLSACGPGQ